MNLIPHVEFLDLIYGFNYPFDLLNPRLLEPFYLL
jgi:hypothetical protein